MRRFGAPLVLALSLLAVPALATGGIHRVKSSLHVVYRGQTLGMIAKRYHVSIAALCRANDIRRGQAIKPKQKLVIPASDDTDGSRARRVFEHRHARVPPPRASATPMSRRRSRSGRTVPAARHYARRPRRRGYVVLHSGSGTWSGYAVRHGKVSSRAEREVSRVLSSWRTGKEATIHSRLIRMLARVSDHFGGRPIRVVSGFRPYSPTQYTPHSRHNLGRAVDLSIPGVPNEVLRDYCRKLPRVGCGYYPHSSFVHMDVRRTSAYWIDQAGPGEPPRYSFVGGAEPTGTDEGAADSRADNSRAASAKRPERHAHPSSRRRHGSPKTRIKNHRKPHKG